MQSGTVSSVASWFSHKTRILPVDCIDLGNFKDRATLDTWLPTTDNDKLAPLHEAAKLLKSSSIPVGFPTETVYGLGADATRSDAVKGIYKAKGRPLDNPLIIHICDLTMLRSLLSPAESGKDSIPDIYKPLIKRFWPGPLTILLPNPSPSKLAPEVTAGLPSFGARMPDSSLALSLIHLAGVPLAAPSANASTKPSPTTAEHVLHDLDGKIEVILDGGPCQVGVESTVVDGLCDPPVVLRPGGVSIDLIRECRGWEGVVRGYKDGSEIGQEAPRAPGMKYKHYSPTARVILYEASFLKRSTVVSDRPGSLIADEIRLDLQSRSMGPLPKVGIVTTKKWSDWAGLHMSTSCRGNPVQEPHNQLYQVEPFDSQYPFPMKQGQLWESVLAEMHTIGNPVADVIQISLSKDTKSIAHGLFSALRELDQKGVDIIYVEGIDDEGDIAAAVMNRLRKAATIIKK